MVWLGIGGGALAGCGGPQTVRPPEAAAPAPDEVPPKASETGTSQGVEAEPGGVPAPARAAFERGLALRETQPDAAIEAFLEAARAAPEFAGAPLNAAVVYDRQGRDGPARRWYAAALKIDPELVSAILGLAGLLERKGQAEKAEAMLRKAVAAQPQAWTVRATLAQLWARREQLPEAHNEAIAVLRGDERNADAMVALGMVFRRQRKFELSELALNQALSIQPSGTAYNELGLVLLAQNEKGRAVQAFEQAANVAPYVAAIHNNLGALRNEVGAFRLALEALERATALEPKRAEYHLNLGNALRGEQRYEEAAAAYETALRLGAHSHDALFNLGVLYLDNVLPNRASDTVARYRKCIEYLQTYMTKTDPAPEERAEVAQYIETAEKAIEGEQKRQEREARRRQRAAERAAKEAEAAAQAEANAAVDAEDAGAAGSESAASDETLDSESAASSEVSAAGEVKDAVADAPPADAATTKTKKKRKKKRGRKKRRGKGS